MELPEKSEDLLATAEFLGGNAYRLSWIGVSFMYLASLIAQHLGRVLVLCLSLLSALGASAQDVSQDSSPIIVTAERYSIAKEKVATSVTVLDAAFIDASQASTVGDLLRTVPGVDVVQSGSWGGNTAVFIRGANSEHTLVYVDGIEANDPVTATRTFDFANIATDNIERIEIVRGPQSVLYGSDAIGGVILIQSKQGCGAPSGSLSFSGGSFATFEERAAVSGGDAESNYSLSASQRNTEGFSSASTRYGNTEDDGQALTNVSALGGRALTDWLRLSLVGRYSHGRTELDNFGGEFGDDPNRVIFDNQLLTRSELGTMFFDGKLTQKLGFNFTDQWFADNNDFDSMNPASAVRSSFVGKSSKVDLQNFIRPVDGVVGVLGYENESEQASSSYNAESPFGPFSDVLDDRTVTTNSYFGQASVDVTSWMTTTAGLRGDSHSKFGTETTWKAGPVVRIDSTKLSATVGTGFKAPSLYQLYSSYGNEDLQPETSKGWDVGAEQSIGRRSSVGVTYFDNEFDNLITFNPATFTSENIEESSAHGIELFGSVKLSEQVTFNGSYTFTDTEDKALSDELLRRPRHKGTMIVVYEPTDRIKLFSSVILRGEREDNDFSTYPATRASLAGYATVAIAAEYRLDESWQIFARGENILDKYYEEVLGFSTQGASVFGGLRYNFG